jgi:hypothetical protein
MGSGGIAPGILTTALDVGEWSASRPGLFNPWQRDHVIHWIGGWVGPSTGLDAVAKRNIPWPFRESNPSRPACSLVTILTELSRLLCQCYILQISLLELNGVRQVLTHLLCPLHSYKCLEGSGIAQSVWRAVYGLDNRGSSPGRCKEGTCSLPQCL